MSLTEEKIAMMLGKIESAMETSEREAAAIRKEHSKIVAKTLKSCLGRVVIHREFMFAPDIDVLQQIFRGFFPVNIDHTHLMDEIVYTGYSYEFREIPELGIIPMYRAIFTVSPTGEKVFQGFEEIDPDFVNSRIVEEGTTDSLIKP